MDGLWILGIAALVLLELYALVNGKPGDTLSGLIWRSLRRWTRGSRRRGAALSLALALLGLWLIWHFAWQPGMPR